MNRYPIRSVAVIARDATSRLATLSEEMGRWFIARSIPCVRLLYDRTCPDLPEKLGNIDLVIVLGGDGTFVGVARNLAGKPKPILGVNLGRVGFLAEVSPDFWESSFSHMLENGVRLESGMVLGYSLLRGDACIQSGLAVNDLVISRGGPARLVSLALTVDDIRLARIRADGLIVATPTGSTGYTNSAGGPLLHPGIDAYSLTPTCPFMSHFSPMVVAGSTRFAIRVDAAGPGTFLTIDGQESVEVRAGDVLETNGIRGGIRFARIDDESYFAKLRSAGFVRDFSG